MSSGADRKRAAMDSWMSRHPSSVSFDDKDEIAYCEAPSSVLGKDAGGDIVVEGLHASRTAAVPVAVKLLPGLSSPPSPPYLIVHRTVPDHPNVGLHHDNVIVLCSARSLRPVSSLRIPNTISSFH